MKAAQPNSALQSEAFKAWFKDSKIVDENGDPLVVYHGTKSEFDQFDLRRFGTTDEGWAGKGVYFTYNPEEASSYALSDVFGRGDSPNVQAVYVSLRNPLIIKHGVMPDGRTVRELHQGISINTKGGAAVRKIAEDAGHDGIVFASRDGQVRHIVAWRLEQIVSAISTENDLRRQTRDVPRQPRLQRRLRPGT